MIDSPPELRICGCGCRDPLPRNPAAVYASRACKQRARARRRRPPRTERVCARAACGATFTERRADARYCSDRCGDLHSHATRAAAKRAVRPRRPCERCDTPIPLQRKASARYCSERCQELRAFPP